MHTYNPKAGGCGICGTCGRDAEWHVMRSFAIIGALREALRQAPLSSATSETPDESLPKTSLLAQIMGANWMSEESKRFSGGEDIPHPVWYEQAESDLTALAGKVPIQKLASCYRSMLRDRHRFVDAVYEIHGAAFLAEIGQCVDLHVPRRPNEKVNYDVRVQIDGVPVHADCQSRRDEFVLSDGMKPVATPEVYLLESALTKLPNAGVNIVLFGQVYGSRADLERALFKGTTKKLLGIRWRRVGTTMFGDARFARLSGVLWMRLLHLGGPLRRYYNLYVNPNAEVPIPPAVVVALDGEIKRRSSGDALRH